MATGREGAKRVAHRVRSRVRVEAKRDQRSVARRGPTTPRDIGVAAISRAAVA